MLQCTNAPPEPSPSRHAVYRKRKREGAPVGKRRSAADLAALEAMPLAERTAEEKEAVRNHRKELKRKERKAAGSALPVALVAAPPPTRSASPPRDASSPAPMRDDSMLLNTADLEDILGRPLSPPNVPAAAASCSSAAAALPLPFPLPSPPPASISPRPLFDTSDNSFPSPPAASSSAAAAAASYSPTITLAASTSAAAASAMSSCSKLKQAILKKRSAMSVPDLNVKRREVSKGIKLGADEDEEVEDEDGKGDGVAAAASEKEQEWAAAEQAYSNKIIDIIVREVKRRKGDHCAGVSPRKADTIRANVHSWAAAARAQRACVGTEDDHQHAAHGLCPREFHPWTFFSKGVVEFAHWKAHKRNNDPNQLIRNRCKTDSNDVFVSWMAEKGRFLYVCCHAIESANERRR